MLLINRVHFAADFFSSAFKICKKKIYFDNYKNVEKYSNSKCWTISLATNFKKPPEIMNDLSRPEVTPQFTEPQKKILFCLMQKKKKTYSPGKARSPPDKTLV